MTPQEAAAATLAGMAVGVALAAVVWTVTWRRLGVPAWRRAEW